LNKIKKQPEQELVKFIIKLNTASIATRYPDNLEKIQAAYTKDVTKEIIKKSRDVLEWIRTQL
jgi:HEPN domain-containing protein